MPEQEFNKAEELIDQLRGYVHTEIELGKLIVAEKISKISSNLIASIFVGVIFLFFLLFISFAFAYMIGNWLEKIWMGFLIVAHFYLVIGIAAWFGREKLLRIPILNAILRQLFPDKQQDSYKK
jgi:vacuolar-type H+-ATPase subunit I/STV1